MKRIWKDVAIISCFVILYCLLVYEHELHLENIVIKELPYILIIFVSIIILLWGSDKMKAYQMKSKLQRKMKSLSDQYNLMYDKAEQTLLSSDEIMDQLHLKLNQKEQQLQTYEYRFRNVAELTNQFIFEYDIISHTLCNSSNWNTLKDGTHFIEESIKQEYIYPDDIAIFRSFFDGPYIIGQVKEINIRLCTKDIPVYYMTLIRGIVVEGIHGEAEKMIGTRIILEKTELKRVL